MLSRCSSLAILFLPTPSTRRATKGYQVGAGASHKFLPTPSTRRATATSGAAWSACGSFLPTPSTRRATWFFALLGGRKFYSPQPPTGGAAGPCKPEATQGGISTHALHEEGDCVILQLSVVKIGFLPTPSTRRATSGQTFGALTVLISTHALHEEGDKFITSISPVHTIFLPTPSTRRATANVTVKQAYYR